MAATVAATVEIARIEEDAPRQVGIVRIRRGRPIGAPRARITELGIVSRTSSRKEDAL